MKESPFIRLVSFLGCFLILSGCGGSSDERAVRKTCADFQTACKEGNPDKIKEFLASNLATQMTDGLKGKDEKTRMALLKAFMPDPIEIVKITVEKDKAKIEARATAGGQAMTGKIKMVREGKLWKVRDVDWDVKIEAGSVGPEIPPPEPVPFFKGPREPPTAQNTLTGHEKEVSRLAFTPDGHFLVSASYGDSTLRTWDPVTGMELSQVKMSHLPTDLAVTRDGGAVVTADSYKNIQVWTLKDGKLGESRTLSSGLGDRFALSRDNRWITLTAFQKPLIVCDFKDGSEIKKLPDTDKDRMVVFTPDSRVMVSAGDRNSITFWDTSNWKGKSFPIPKVPEGSTALAMAMSRDGKFVVVAFNETTLSVWDVEKRKEFQNFYLPDRCAMDLAFSGDSGWFAAAHNDKTIYLWDAKEGRQKGRLSQHQDVPGSLAFSPNGGILASGGADRVIILWGNGPPPAPVAPPTAAVLSATNAAPATVSESAPPLSPLDMAGASATNSAPIAASIPEPPKPEASWFKVTSLMGEPDAADVKVGINSQFNVAIGEEFVFERDGSKFPMKIKSVTAKEVTIEWEGREIVVPWKL